MWKNQQWETDGWIWTVLQRKKKKVRLVSKNLLRTEVRIIHTTGTKLFWKLLFQLRSQISLSSSASKYLVCVISHSDFPASPSLFLFTSLHYPVTIITRSSTEELATLYRCVLKHNDYVYFNISFSWSRSIEGLICLELWKSHVSSKIPTKNMTSWTWREFTYFWTYKS